MRKPLAALLQLVLVTAALAQGQDADAVKAMRADARFRQAAEKTFLDYEASLSTHCTLIQPDWARAEQHFYGQPVLDAQNLLSNATWSETVPGTVCGQPRRFRALVVIRGGKASMQRMLPGESNVSATLEHDTRLAVVSAAAAHLKGAAAGCNLDILDTEIEGHRIPAAHTPWNEVWLIALCGHRMKVPIAFLPDATGSGTTFDIAMKSITDVQ